MSKNQLKDKTILITGATGFIGVPLTQRLLEERARVHILFKDEAKLWRLGKAVDKIHKHRVGLEEATSLKKIIRKIKPEIIFHLATYGTISSQDDFGQMLKTNILGTVNLLRALEGWDYQLLVNTGSSSEYGRKNSQVKEEDVLSPLSLYASSKASQTLICQTYAKVFSQPIVTLRPFLVYGPGEDEGKFIPTIIKNCLKKKKVVISFPNQKRDFVFVDDLVQAYIKAAQKKNLAGRIINIATGRPYTINEVVKKIIELTGVSVAVEYANNKKNLHNIDYWVGNNLLAKKLLGWQPKISLEEGLKKTIAWYAHEKN